MIPTFFMDSLAGVDFNPTHYVDITGQIEMKLKALEMHESQIKWMLDHDGIDFVDMIRTCSRYRGYQCGVAYAEGFRPYNPSQHQAPASVTGCVSAVARKSEKTRRNESNEHKSNHVKQQKERRRTG